MSPQSAGPGYWMNETGGELQVAIRRYLEGIPLSIRDISLIRAYIRQWIGSEVWDTNPNIDEEGRKELAELRQRANVLSNRAEIDYWIVLATDIGLDPL